MNNKNLFPFSNDNKRYYTWNYYLKKQYGSKAFKVSLNAGFSCPNRDGTCGVGGCSFCGSLGSGEFAGDIHHNLYQQFLEGKQELQNKRPNSLVIAYFQAYTNTYAPLSILKDTFEPFIKNDDVIALSIATRADCLEDDKIAYLNSLCTQKDIWIELGLQSIHDKTAENVNRGHTYSQFLDCVERLSHTNLKVVVHLINSLPYETSEDMIDSARALAKLPIHAVKLHMLHIMEDTKMANEYQQSPFPILSKEEYVDIIVRQLEVLPPTMMIQRLTGDGEKSHLIVPLWTLNKISVLNEIDKEMVRRDTWQGKKYR